MRIPRIKLSFFVALFLFCIETNWAVAESLKAVVLEAQGDRVVINRGSEDGVRVGQAWVFGPEGSSGGVLIEQVRQHSASGRLQGEAEVGSLASLGQKSDLDSFVSEKRAQEMLSTRVSTDSQSLEQLRKKYRNALSKHTQSRGFVTPMGGSAGIPTAQIMGMGVEAYNAYRVYDLSRSFGLDPTGMYQPWWLAASAVNMASGQMSRKKMYEPFRVRVDVEVVHWDEDLVDLQTEVMAAEQGLSLTETLHQKVQMQSKRGTNKYTVFEVNLKNVGKTPAEIGNFKYRMFMKSSEDKPISASRVDSVLDKTLQPGDEVRGMVYFPKIVAAGQKEITVVFEQMFGDRGELNFRH